MQQYETELEKRNARVIIISFEAGFLAKAYIEDTGLRWPVLIDTNRELYRAYSMLEAGFLDIWGPQTWKAYIKELMHGRFPRKSEGDISQRGGDILVDPEAIVRFHHVGLGPADRPSVKSILSVLDRETRGN